MMVATAPSTVLVVDDEDGPREALRLVLESQFRVLTADGGAAALRALAETPVDVVTLDLRMPGMDGFETLRRIHALDPEIEVVIVSAVPPFQVDRESPRMRAFDVVRKPFSATEMMATAERAAAHRFARRGEAKPTASVS
jgi:DNA-binding NtrC family response regulator